MKLGIILYSFFIIFLSNSLAAEENSWEKLLDRPELKITNADMIIYDHFLQIYNVAEKGYASAYLLDKGLKESTKNPKLAIFHEWLLDLKRFPQLTSEELLQTCSDLRGRLKTTYGLSRKLLLQRLVFCRQIALQQMAPRALADGGFTVQDLAFLKKFMRNFIYGKNQADMIWFLQRFEKTEGIKQILSTLITENILKQSKEVPRDFLSLINITPDLTRHIQSYGFDTKSTEQVFYSEYSRMIEGMYKVIDDKKKDKILSKYTELRNWLALNLERLPQATTLGRFSDLGKNLWRNGYNDAAAEIFDFVASKQYQDQKEDAWFFRLWMWGAKDEWKDAISWTKDIKIIQRIESLNDSRLKYWIGYGLLKIDQKNEAKKVWENLIEKHPLSFYGIMASKMLQAHHPDSSYCQYYKKIDERNTPTLLAKDIDPSIWEAWKRLKAWSRLDAKSFLYAELRGLHKNFIPGLAQRAQTANKRNVESDAILLTAALIGSEENYIESFKVLYGGIDSQKVVFNRFLLETLYPKPFYEELQKALKSYKIDPLILLSLIRQESVFNPEAKSRVGARGLMQLMPTTARRLQRSVRDKHLILPKTNLEIGAKYFQQLFRRYEGNLIYVLSAYNAGESRVERWKDSYFVSEEMLPNIESIPFLETRNYVKLIFRNLYFYKTLEGSKDLSDPTNHNQIYDVALGFKR
ncbi:MAG: lytic transglycosylase domain-containing protein [Bacteriovoracaceae bacterium]|nr:lytic transglycosylase domain-containing protein [Bacteriovoracaceae bacterium]